MLFEQGAEIQRGLAGGTACPTCQALAIERNGSAHFPRQAEIAATSGVLKFGESVVSPAAGMRGSSRG
jgi:hypothetical protein